MNILVTGNQAGFKKHFPHWNKEYIDNFMEDLQEAVNATLPLDKHITQIQDLCPQTMHATNHTPTKSELKKLGYPGETAYNKHKSDQSNQKDERGPLPNPNRAKADLSSTLRIALAPAPPLEI